jgi:hypothetical protein
MMRYSALTGAVEMETNAENVRPRSPSAAERMRLHRERRRRGLRRVQVELHVTEIEALIRKGYLAHGSRNDRDAVELAIGAFVWDALIEEA